MVRLIKMADPPPYGQLFVIFFGIHSTLDLYIIGRFCLSVCLSRKMITLPNCLKSHLGGDFHVWGEIFNVWGEIFNVWGEISWFFRVPG